MTFVAFSYRSVAASEFGSQSAPLIDDVRLSQEVSLGSGVPEEACS